MAESVGFEPTVRFSPTPIFETGTLNQLRQLSIMDILEAPLIYRGASFFGGEGGIRTHDGLQTHANFQDWCLKPTRPPLHINNKYKFNMRKPKSQVFL